MEVAGSYKEVMKIELVEDGVTDGNTSSARCTGI